MWTVWPSARCQRDSFYLIALPFEGIVHDEGHFCSFDQCLHISTYDIRWHISHQSSLHMALWIDKSDVWEAIDTKLPCPKIILKVPGKRRAYPGSLEGSSIPASMIFIYRYIYIYIFCARTSSIKKVWKEWKTLWELGEVTLRPIIFCSSLGLRRRHPLSQTRCPSRLAAWALIELVPSVGNLDTNLQRSRQPPVFRTSRPRQYDYNNKI